MSQARTRSRPVHLTGERGNLSLDGGMSNDDDQIVATAQVPSTQVWGVPTGEPLVVALITRQTFSVDEGTTGQVLDLDPAAPKADFMDDFEGGEYTAEAYIAGYHSGSGGGSTDTLMTGESTVQYTGTTTGDADFVESVEVDDTSGNSGTKDVTLYTVVESGYAYIQKRSSGKSNVSDELQREDSLTWAFSNPDAPDADRQITWEESISGLDGVIPPKFYVDIVYYSRNATNVPLDGAQASNVHIDVPLTQRPVGENEDPSTLRRRVRQEMSG